MIVGVSPCGCLIGAVEMVSFGLLHLSLRRMGRILLFQHLSAKAPCVHRRCWSSRPVQELDSWEGICTRYASVETDASGCKARLVCFIQMFFSRFMQRWYELRDFLIFSTLRVLFSSRLVTP